MSWKTVLMLLFFTSLEICWTPKESKYNTFLKKLCNAIQWNLVSKYSSRCAIFALSFILVNCFYQRLFWLFFFFKRICILKKGGWNSNDNYRPVSILPDMSKIFERCIFCLLYNFMLEFLSNSQRVFRKDYSTRQHCLFSMLEKSAVDKEKSFGTLLTPFLRHLTVFLKNFCLLISWLWI